MTPRSVFLQMCMCKNVENIKTQWYCEVVKFVSSFVGDIIIGTTEPILKIVSPIESYILYPGWRDVGRLSKTKFDNFIDDELTIETKRTKGEEKQIWTFAEWHAATEIIFILCQQTISKRFPILSLSAVYIRQMVLVETCSLESRRVVLWKSFVVYRKPLSALLFAKTGQKLFDIIWLY